MVRFCAVYGCSNSGYPYKFYGFPKVRKSNAQHEAIIRKRRSAWFRALHRSDITEDDLNARCVCDRHFISGKPAPLFATHHPDWVPTVKISTSKLDPPDTQNGPYTPVKKKFSITTLQPYVRLTRVSVPKQPEPISVQDEPPVSIDVTVNGTSIFNFTQSPNKKQPICLIDAQTQTDMSSDYFDKLERSTEMLMELRNAMSKPEGDVSTIREIALSEIRNTV